MLRQFHVYIISSWGSRKLGKRAEEGCEPSEIGKREARGEYLEISIAHIHPYRTHDRISQYYFSSRCKSLIISSLPVFLWKLLFLRVHITYFFVPHLITVFFAFSLLFFFHTKQQITAHFTAQYIINRKGLFVCLEKYSLISCDEVSSSNYATLLL